MELCTTPKLSQQTLFLLFANLPCLSLPLPCLLYVVVPSPVSGPHVEEPGVFDVRVVAAMAPACPARERISVPHPDREHVQDPEDRRA